MSLQDFQQPDQISQALGQKRIAVVGMSPNPARDSHGVAVYMQQFGYDIVPVNPRETTILGLPCYPNLSAIPEPVQMVDVFRASDAVPEIVEETLALGIGFLWLQLGVIHLTAAAQAQAAGTVVIMDKCLKVEHAREGAPSIS